MVYVALMVPWFKCFRFSWRNSTKSSQKLNMPQSLANTRACQSITFPQASAHSQVRKAGLFFGRKFSQKWKTMNWQRWPQCDSFPPPERRSAMKLPPVVSVPLDHLDPQTPQLSQLISQWQKLWHHGVERKNRLEQHQQMLKEVIGLFVWYF